ncbi:MAG: polysaccharide deacetylase family protein [Chlorobia bacterium]|nr:polysaccharide deacetylase family protein [Fimbriimonadaceae bacterium]
MPKTLNHLFCAGAIALGVLGCGESKPVVAESEGKIETPVKQPTIANRKVPPKRVTNRPANRDGVVFIAEYHHIRKGKSTMERAPNLLRRDLERLYKLGFRPINVKEFLAGRFELPPGASPVVLTFDDANPSQVRFDAEGKLDPECGLGILEEFSKSHPDFPPKATFFVLPELWGQPADRAKKIEMIKAWGGEVANHTVTHPNLGRLTDQRVKEEIAGSFKLLEPFGGNPELLALPLGISPKNKSLLKSFELQGKNYNLDAVFLVGANPAPPPTSAKFDRYRIPRIQACEGPFGLDDWLDKLETGQVKPYVAP